MSPEAAALLMALAARPLANANISDANREALRELYDLDLVDLYEPPPYEWRLTHAGKRKADL